METKKFIQQGTFSIIVLGSFFLLTLVAAFIIGPSDTMPFIVLCIVALTMGICLLIFYKLTITVDQTHLSFRLGIGLVSRKFRLADIKECKAVRNSPLTGIGIRLYSRGWLYNVSGLGAVELSFHNRDSCIRIGTDKAEEVAGFICARIGGGAPSPPEPFNPVRGYILAGIVMLAVFLPVVFVLTGRRETKVEMNDTAISLNGIYGFTLKYSEISSIDTVSSLPRIRARTNGYAMGEILKGNFRLDDGEDVRLFVNTSSTPYILIKSAGKPVFLNFIDPEKTRNVYTELFENSNQ